VDEILLPGEPEERTFLERLTGGIPIPEPTVKSLMTLGERMGVKFPQPAD
jgi:LDH2 family malate/lactate/ureidoglycolate dehydrogenase